MIGKKGDKWGRGEYWKQGGRRKRYVHRVTSGRYQYSKHIEDEGRGEKEIKEKER